MKMAPPAGLEPSERLRSQAPSAANFATQKFAPVHALREQVVATPQVKQKSQNKRQVTDLPFVLSYPNNFEPLAKIIYQNNLVKTRTIQANYMHHKVAKILLHDKDSFLRHIRNGHELSL